MTTLYERFLKMKEEDKKFDSSDINGKVLIVDGLNSYIRCFSAVPTMDDDGDHIGGTTGFLKSIGLAIRTFRPTRVVIAFDGKGGSARRRKLFPEYKDNRKSMQRLNRTYNFKDREAEAQAMRKQLSILIEALKCLPIIVLAPQNVEADDVIAYIAQIIEEKGGKSIIMSTDKDFLQTVNESVDVWNPIKKKMYHVDSVLEEYGIHPNNFAIFRAMDGDKSDNIPGVRGVGRKLLLRKFPQLAKSEKLTISTILDSAISLEKNKMFENIRNNKALIERNYELMNLGKVMMSGQLKIEVLDRINTDQLQLDKSALTELLANQQMIGSFGNYDQWVLTTFAPLMRYTVE